MPLFSKHKQHAEVMQESSSSTAGECCARFHHQHACVDTVAAQPHLRSQATTSPLTMPNNHTHTHKTDERPPLKSAASAPESADKAGHALQIDQEQPAASTTAADHVHRSKSEPAGGAKQRPGGLPQKDTLTESQKQTLQHVQVWVWLRFQCVAFIFFFCNLKGLRGAATEPRCVLVSVLSLSTMDAHSELNMSLRVLPSLLARADAEQGDGQCNNDTYHKKTVWPGRNDRSGPVRRYVAVDAAASQSVS